MHNRRRRLVVALGGNALLRRGEPPAIQTQRRMARQAANALAPLARDNELIITHGNGPQIGHLALQQQHETASLLRPLDVLGAETEGLIGYLLELELRRVLPDHDVATVLTLVEIDPQDPEMHRPTKPIGPIYSAAEWADISRNTGWPSVPDGQGVRRAVPSPRPVRMLQHDAIVTLLDAGIVPICAGGGGVPVSMAADDGPVGVEAVIDKDWTSATLAAAIGADMLIMLTDVDAVYRDWGTPDAEPLTSLAPDQIADMQLPGGTIGPKVQAAQWFVSSARYSECGPQNRRAAIGALEAAVEIANAEAGTQFGPV